MKFKKHLSYVDLVRPKTADDVQIEKMKEVLSPVMNRDEKDYLDQLLLAKIKTAEMMKSNSDILDIDKIKGINKGLMNVLKKYINNKDIKGIKGIIVYGPPGTGKTELANALCKNLGLALVEISEDILTGRPGESITKLNIVKKVVEQYARKGQTCMLLLDEADGIFKQRSAIVSDAAINVASAGVTNFFLKWFNEKSANNLVVFATTNDIKRVDTALINRMTIRLEAKGLSEQDYFENVDAVYNKYIRSNVKNIIETSIHNANINRIADFDKFYDENNQAFKDFKDKLDNDGYVNYEACRNQIKKVSDNFIKSKNIVDLEKYLNRLVKIKVDGIDFDFLNNTTNVLLGTNYKHIKEGIQSDAAQIETFSETSLQEIVYKMIFKYLIVIPNSKKDNGTGSLTINAQEDTTMKDVIRMFFVLFEASPRVVELALKLISIQEYNKDISQYLWSGFSFGSVKKKTKKRAPKASSASSARSRSRNPKKARRPKRSSRLTHKIKRRRSGKIRVLRI